ncbi:MAG: hypothetical protein KDC54_12250 [Lewinella sp.]|nr:hypothetical protein [Lewinella sp.]
MTRLLYIAALLCLGAIGRAQSIDNPITPEDWAFLETMEDSLGVLGYAIVNDSVPENRFGSVYAFIPMLVRALRTPNSFHYPFAQLNTVSIQYAADSTFRILTWQLFVDRDDYRYFGAIQMNTPELKLFPLRDRSDSFSGNLEEARFTPEDWYGAIYYKVYTVTDGPQPHYLLFGFDGYSFLRKRKYIDVLTFDEAGQPHFGAPVFVFPNPDSPRYPTTRNRIVLEYSAEASVRCNYDEALGIIIYDHLMTVSGNYGEGPTNIPDGTYEGFELKDGRWQYIEKVFHEVMDEAPRPEPILDVRTRDIMGRGGS